MSSMHTDVIEEFPLRKLSKDESFTQTCQAFVSALKLGVCVMDAEGNIITDVRHDNEEHCRIFNSVHEGRRHCSTTLDAVRSARFEDNLEPRELSCASGLVYWVSPILFGGEHLGVSILGPIRTWTQRPDSQERLVILNQELEESTLSLIHI